MRSTLRQHVGSALSHALLDAILAGSPWPDTAREPLASTSASGASPVGGPLTGDISGPGSAELLAVDAEVLSSLGHLDLDNGGSVDRQGVDADARSLKGFT